MTREEKSNSCFEQALGLIRQRAGEGITIAQILAALPVSRSTLERQFAQCLGRSPGQEMLRLREDLAKELLLTTDLPLKAVAGRVGYRDASAFGVFFRKAVGLSPAEFRQQAAKGRSSAASGAHNGVVGMRASCPPTI